MPESETIDEPMVHSRPDSRDRTTSELPEWLRVSAKPPVVHALVLANTIVFAMMAGTTGIKSLFIPSSQVLLHFGASSGAATIIDGQFWRTLTSAFVHIGFLHLMMNCYVLWDVGPLVEKLFGSRKFIAIYVMAALGASLCSLMTDPTVVSAGASGAIFGLFGALIAFFWHHRTKFPPRFLRLHAKIIVIFVFYGIVYGALMQGVDNAAHIGGLIFGFIAAYCVMPSRPGNTRYHRIDALLTVGLCVAFLAFLAIDCQSIARNELVLGDAAYQQAVESLQSQKPIEALPLLNRAIRFMPEVSSVWWDRARAYEQLGQYDLALRDSDRAVELSPKNKTAYMVRSSILHNLGRDGESIRDLSQVIALDPKSALAYNNRAWDYAASGNYQAAMQDVEAAIKYDKNCANSYDTRAVARLLNNDCAGALSDCNKALTLKHSEGGYVFHRACVYEKLGRSELAANDLKRSQLLGYKPEPWEVHLRSK